MARPVVQVIARCNGSGKSSFSSRLSPKGILPFDYDKHYLKIYSELHDIDIKDAMAHNLARQELNVAIETAIQARSSFCYETNFNSTQLFWPNYFKSEKYELELIFFCLDSIEEAKRRVQIRVENGGHFVPEDEIRNRFYDGYKNLDAHFKFFNRVHLIDSSYYNKEPMHILSMQNGSIISVSKVPDFLSSLIPNILSLI